MLKRICEKNKCTACRACQNVCPKDCITFIENEYGVKNAYMDTDMCAKCNLCSKVCPTTTRLVGSQPIDCYAAWSLTNTVRHKSASGGVATELYRYAIDNEYWIAGVEIDSEGSAFYSLTNNDYMRYQNSKYTFSDMLNIYLNISDKLIRNEKVLFIGLPCQVTALKSFLRLKKVPEMNIVFVDLVCHGITSELYLKQHVSNIEHRKKKNSTKIFFRDHRYGTHIFFFTLEDNGIVFYKKNVEQDDEYQIAYHCGIAYRENCYSCPWACKERMGDLTLSDFIGLGSAEKCDYSDKNVSCVMINTDKGKEIYSELVQSKYIFSEQRPLEENIRFQPTLNNSTLSPKERKEFLSLYKDSKDFDFAIRVAAKDIIKRNRLNSLLHYKDIKIFCLSLFPRSLKDKVKRILRR